HPPPAAASAASRGVLNPSVPHSLDHARASTVAISLRSSITLKASIKKLTFEKIDIKDFPRYAREMGFTIMDMKERETITFHKLPLKGNHKDPFDRMLIWQAITNDMILLSKDTSINT
ncbi:MAG: hypothetical protein LBK61_14580, partial [Spirochaetaceae bacterium]|nr:hypothetical protein [Spirochaetaceae bacterium]